MPRSNTSRLSCAPTFGLLPFWAQQTATADAVPVAARPVRQTAWQQGPTKVENPGQTIKFEDLPSAFTPIEDLDAQ